MACHSLPPLPSTAWHCGTVRYFDAVDDDRRKADEELAAAAAAAALEPKDDHDQRCA